MTPEQSVDLIVRFTKRITNPRVMRSAAHRAAMRGVGILKEATPVDTGLMRRSWRVKKTSTGARLENDAPYAALVEFGTKPHAPPWEPIIRWVARKQQVSLSGYDLSKYGQARPLGAIKGVRKQRKDFAIQWVVAMARGLVDKIMLFGLKPKHYVRGAMPKLQKAYAEEVIKEIRRLAKKGIR